MLPGGYWDCAGVLHREFELAMLTGHDEEFLVQRRGAPSAVLLTSVLSRTVRRIGNVCPVTEEVARELLVADRQYLLLKLRQLNFGERVHADVFCPWPGCSSRISLAFNLSEVPVQEAKSRGVWFTLTLSPEGCPSTESAQREVTFRLPNGADQELVCAQASNEADALNRLLERTLRGVGPHSATGRELVEALSPLSRGEVEAEMERLAPKVDLSMETACSECGRGFVVAFDLQRCFFGALRIDAELLYRQVHSLAYHYHWSEASILELTRDKRHLYSELVSDELGRDHGH